MEGFGPCFARVIKQGTISLTLGLEYKGPIIIGIFQFAETVYFLRQVNVRQLKEYIGTEVANEACYIANKFGWFPFDNWAILDVSQHG